MVTHTTCLFEFGALSIELPSPAWGNTEYQDDGIINRVTLGGDIKLYRDGNWPQIARCSLTFAALTKDEADALATFLASTLGQSIVLTDHNDVTWTGVIMTPDNPITQRARNFWGVTLEIQGVRS